MGWKGGGRVTMGWEGHESAERTTWVSEGGEAAAEGGAGDALQQNHPSPAAPAPADQ